MRQPRVYRAEAVVLKAYDFGEADRIITFYTLDAGLLRAVAKGVRRTKSRMSGHLDLFTRSSLFVVRGRQLDIVTQAETLESFQPIRVDLLRSTYCHYVAELVEGFAGENLANQALYQLTVQTFRRLSTATDLALVIRGFELQLLAFTGYRPQLFRCLSCDATIEPRVNRFSPKMGGVLCADCGAADVSAPAISVPALKLMRNLQANESATLGISTLDPQTHREVERRLHEYIVFRLERRPRSLGFIERLRAESLAP